VHPEERIKSELAGELVVDREVTSRPWSTRQLAAALLEIRNGFNAKLVDERGGNEDCRRRLVLLRPGARAAVVISWKGASGSQD
jgi:hypothetical protein